MRNWMYAPLINEDSLEAIYILTTDFKTIIPEFIENTEQ